MMGTILHRRAGAELPDKLEPMSRLQASVHAVTNTAPEKVGFISLGIYWWPTCFGALACFILFPSGLLLGGLMM